MGAPDDAERRYKVNVHEVFGLLRRPRFLVVLPALGPVYANPAYALTVTPTLEAGRSAHVLEIGTLTGNITIANPTGAAPQNGDSLTIAFTQDATGGRTVTWGTAYVNGPTIAGTAGARDLVSFVYLGAAWVTGR